MYQVINGQSRAFDESAGSTPIHQLGDNLLPSNDTALSNPYNTEKNDMKNELKNFLKKQINR